MGKSLLWLALCLLLPGCAPRLPPAAARPSSPKWLVLYYGSADCDLEGHMMDDQRELASVGASPEVEVLALIDRSPKNSRESGYSDEALGNLRAWTGARLLHPTRERVELLEDWRLTNMASQATFERFLASATQIYPGRRIVVILSGHGAGPTGMALDDSAPDDLLTPEEMAAAFQHCHLQAELIGLDACLMSHLEVAEKLAPYARVLVASQESEPESGWDYASLLRDLQARPDMTGVQLGGVVSRSYQRSFDRNRDSSVQEEGKSITLSVVQLDQLGQVKRALDRLARICLRDPQACKQLQAVLQTMPSFGLSDPPEEGEVPYYDLNELAERLGKVAPLRASAGELLQAGRRAVALKVQGRQQAHAGGLSVGLQENLDENSFWTLLGNRLVAD